MKNVKEINVYKTEFNKENYDRKQIYLAKGMNDKLKTIAKKQGVSVNAWINKAIQEKIERDEKMAGDTTDGE